MICALARMLWRFAAARHDAMLPCCCRLRQCRHKLNEMPRVVTPATHAAAIVTMYTFAMLIFRYYAMPRVTLMPDDAAFDGALLLLRF